MISKYFVGQRGSAEEETVIIRTAGTVPYHNPKEEEVQYLSRRELRLLCPMLIGVSNRVIIVKRNEFRLNPMSFHRSDRP